ncbi:hypothetical protein EXIGLDRAFT_721521 [Exidia glandulosa HHB12029]|uniref:Uncharacterized protein n=1 Tax=Exidia glandulosa HHB12029 TaxID=1314781 RepID=A0A165FQ06_EXIGL|nr:hypothetical protein EXIGLDRAFT_721521 [Exidia glandulosa HHB12029]
MADLLDRLPALTHFAMRMTGPGDGTRISGTPFYDPKAFLAVFKPILALARIQQVVVRISGYYLPLYDKAMECLRTLRDPRIFAIKDEWELLSWDDLSPQELDEAHEGQSIWDLGRRVYEP